MVLWIVITFALAICMHQSPHSLLSPNAHRFAYQYWGCFVEPVLHGYHESYVSQGQRSYVHAVDLALERHSHNNNNRREILFAVHCTPGKVDLVITGMYALLWWTMQQQVHTHKHKKFTSDAWSNLTNSSCNTSTSVLTGSWVVMYV